MNKTLVILLVILSITPLLKAQSITGKIIDSKTGESIPYANIMINETEDFISNAEGYFSISENLSNDESVLTISYLGYVNRRLTIAELKKLNYTIKLEQGIFELNDVEVSKEDTNPFKIMAKVKENLDRNYKNDGNPTKDRLFIRNSNFFNPTKFEFTIDKSTEMSKKALQSANNDLNTYSSILIAHPPQEFTDILCDYYSVKTIKDEKPSVLSKLDVLKATKLRNEKRSISFDELEKKFTNIMLKNLDSTKYYRVKSGLFGSRDTVSLRKDYNKKKYLKVENNVGIEKSELESFKNQQNIIKNEKFGFINHPEWYNYEYEAVAYSKENEFVYIIRFSPKKSKAKYIGKLYVSEKDYAVLRADYKLEDGKTEFGFNMKFLLGVKVSVNVSNGTLIFKENPIDKGYYLHYASIENGYYFYFDRPIKFIELTKEEKDIVSFDLKVEGRTKEKNEFLNISHTSSSKSTIENFTENDFKYINLKKYDSNIWKDYIAIEPLEEMKQFKAED
ncbi:MAG TPA: carboxypeptidase-like regulatory domain-containing protein [Flavobacterium sp.]|nr:carboxypeptidase-like regulatory domain-containing protein [Flavobacterium sp.]